MSLNPEDYFNFKEYKLDNEMELLDNDDLSIVLTGYSVGYDFHETSMTEPHALMLNLKITNKEDVTRSYYGDTNTESWFKDKNGNYVKHGSSVASMKAQLIVGPGATEESYTLIRTTKDGVINELINNAGKYHQGLAVRDSSYNVVKTYPIDIDLAKLFKNAKQVS